MSFFQIISVFDDELEDKYLVIKLSGDVNIHYRIEMESFFQKKLRTNFKDVIIDMSEVKYIDSVGLAVLINVYKKVVAQRKRFYLVGLSDRVRKVFKMSGLEKILDIYETIDSLKADLLVDEEKK